MTASSSSEKEQTSVAETVDRCLRQGYYAGRILPTREVPAVDDSPSAIRSHKFVDITPIPAGYRQSAAAMLAP